MKKALFVSISINCLIVFFIVGKRYYYSRNTDADTVAPNSFHDQWNYMRSSVLNKLPIDNKDVVFVGNSLTEAFPVSEVFGHCCKNRGIGGNTTSHILARIGPIASKRPAKIFIEGGINDLIAAVSVDSIFKNYRDIIDLIRDTAYSTALYVQSIFPTSKTYANLNNSIMQLNKMLSDHCVAIGVTYIDIYSNLSKDGRLNSQLTEDGIHLNEKGYQIWQQAIESYVR
jgi:lysophospholipase L1-like esterase